MNDVLKQRLVGALILVALGVSLYRCICLTVSLLDHRLPSADLPDEDLTRSRRM